MADVCTIIGNTLTCTKEFDWDALVVAIVPAVVGIGVAVLAAFLTNRHQRKEASKQRVINAAGAVILATYSTLRSSHRDEAGFRDNLSLLEISIRSFAVDVIGDYQPFVEELMEWTKRLHQDYKALGWRHESGDHDTEDIKEAQSVTHLFVNYITDWLPANPAHRRVIATEMTKRRLELWPDMQYNMRIWP